MSGGELAGKVGSLSEGITFSGKRMKLSIGDQGGNELVRDLRVEVADESGKPRMVTGISIAKGGLMIFRSAYPEPEGFLIVVGKDEANASE